MFSIMGSTITPVGGVNMDALDRILQDDLNRLVDRLAAGLPAGAVWHAATERPDLRARAEALEADLASCRTILLLHYRHWRESLEELADLWSLAAVPRGPRLDAEEEPVPASLRAA
jgi:hypothetical protein